MTLSPVLAHATDEQLDVLQQAAEATLGHPVQDAAVFRHNCQMLGLGDALNLEHDLAD
ncbi:hypothetical protein [Rhodococcus ruber]|uniref:hypothetical protein n=1 Tax=Rhodococcus ruber TaxID=1830 RepID=UPI001F3F7319|nr:hypothetical protein [Rhodococcus ruber]MCF8785256.1 hypothetical protein [Rhodococcus ruber]